jgi:hypothetical protein
MFEHFLHRLLHKFQKIVIALLLISLITTSAYAVNVFDRILYKKVFLLANKMYVLVTQIAGEVKFIRLNNGQWVRLTGVWKCQIQSIYNAQVASKNR